MDWYALGNVLLLNRKTYGRMSCQPYCRIEESLDRVLDESEFDGQIIGSKNGCHASGVDGPSFILLVWSPISRTQWMDGWMVSVPSFSNWPHWLPTHLFGLSSTWEGITLTVPSLVVNPIDLTRWSTVLAMNDADWKSSVKNVWITKYM